MPRVDAPLVPRGADQGAEHAGTPSNTASAHCNVALVGMSGGRGIAVNRIAASDVAIAVFGGYAARAISRGTI